MLLPSDRHLLALCADVGLSGDVYWREASLGFLYARRLYGLRGPVDLLRFGAVPLIDRIRLGFTALYAAHIASSNGLDDITTREWLTRLSGRRAFERLWRPLLEAKFGDAYDRIPALWYWASFRREKGTRKEIKGYLRGGYKRLTDALVASLEARGASLHAGTPVARIDLADDGRPRITAASIDRLFDRVVSTVPFAMFRPMVAGGALEAPLRGIDQPIDYQGVVNVIVILRRSLTPYYWIPIVASDAPFQGIVETTHVIDRADTGGHHLAYLLNYVHRTKPIYNRPAEELTTDYTRALLDLFPSLSRADIVDAFTFKAPYVEPLYTPGYNRRKPPEELVRGRVYLATTTQVYPDVTSWNSSTRLAKNVVRRLVTAASGPA